MKYLASRKLTPILKQEICLMGNVAFKKILLLFLFFCIGTNAFASQNFSEPPPTFLKEDQVTRLYELDLTNVFFAVRTTREFYDHLFLKAIDLFKKANLPIKSIGVYEPSNLVLELTLEIEPVGNDCQKYFLYNESLQLQETVIPERSLNARTWSTTWNFGLPTTIVDKPIGLEELEKNLDNLIGTFIREYKLANSMKNAIKKSE